MGRKNEEACITDCRGWMNAPAKVYTLRCPAWTNT